jgi:hypothetical protein
MSAYNTDIFIAKVLGLKLFKDIVFKSKENVEVKVDDAVKWCFKRLNERHIEFLNLYETHSRGRRFNYRDTKYYCYISEAVNRKGFIPSKRNKIKEFIKLYKKIKDEGYKSDVGKPIILIDFSKVYKHINLDIIPKDRPVEIECFKQIKNGNLMYFRDNGDHRVAILKYLGVEKCKATIETIYMRNKNE